MMFQIIFAICQKKEPRVPWDLSDILTNFSFKLNSRLGSFF